MMEYPNKSAASVLSGVRASGGCQGGLRRVLCPIDISQVEAGKPQLSVSWSLAKRSGAELDCLFVNPFYDMHAGYGPFLEGAAYSDIAQSVSPADLIRKDKKKMKALLEDAGVPVADPLVLTECQVGPVFTTVRDWMSACQGASSDSMIVITKTESAGFTDFVLGSLATRIIRSSNVPCLVLPQGRVRPGWEPTTAIMGFALDSPNVTEHDFVATLPSLGCRNVTLVHAFKREPVLQAAETYRTVTGRPNGDLEIYNLVEDNIRHRLEAAAEMLPPSFTERSIAFEPGKPEEILYRACAAVDPQAAVLVLGRSVPATELGYLGSTLQHLVSAARIPVLILPFGS
jgi:nucleotide-binding universal stress UspA family protein